MEQLLESTGTCGLFQLWIITSTNWLPQLIASWGTSFMAFGNYDPGWICLQPNATANTTSGVDLNRANATYNTAYAMAAGSPVKRGDGLLTTWGADAGDGSTADNCTLFNNCQPSSPELQQQLFSCAEMHACPASRFQGDSSTIVTEWGLVCERAWVPSFIISIQMVGQFVGTVIAGQVGERWGRKKGLFMNVALSLVSNVVAFFSVSWEMFAAVRFFNGVAASGIITLYAPYSYEFLNHRWRANIAGVPNWYISLCVFSLFTFLLRDWRQLHILSACISLLALLPVFCTPESLRWLMVNRKTRKASSVVKMMAKMNMKPLPESKKILEVLEREQEAHVVHYTYLSLFNKHFRSMTIRIACVWTLMSIAYFAIYFGVKSLSGDFYLNFSLLNLLGLIPGFLTTPVLRLCGRRWGISLFFFFTALFCSSIVLSEFFAPSGIRETATMVMAVSATVFLYAAWVGFCLYLAELYPTVVRLLASGLSFSFARVGGVIAPLLIPSEPSLLYVSYAIMAAMAFVCCAITATLPETKGKPLQDSIEVEIPLKNNGDPDLSDEVDALRGVDTGNCK